MRKELQKGWQILRELPPGFTFESFVIDSLGDLKDKVDDLCTRTTVVETRYQEHIAGKVREAESKWKKLTAIFAAIGSISAIAATLNVINNWK